MVAAIAAGQGCAHSPRRHSRRVSRLPAVDTLLGCCPGRYALTGKEVKSILMQRLVKVDGKVRGGRMQGERASSVVQRCEIAGSKGWGHTCAGAA